MMIVLTLGSIGCSWLVLLRCDGARVNMACDDSTNLGSIGDGCSRHLIGLVIEVNRG